MVREVLDHYGIYYEEISHSKSELSYYCPFHIHSDENLGSSRFDEENEIFNCFACGEGGNIYQFVMRLENCDFKTAKALIDSNFEVLNQYSINKLKNNLNRTYNALIKKRKSDDIKILHKMLKLLSTERPSKEFIFKWFPVFVSITTCDYSQTDLLNFYTVFLQSLNQEKELANE